MNCKKLIKGTIVAVVTALFFAGAPLWAGQILVDVNDPACVSGTGQLDPYSVVYCNIQDAVTDATAGDVINVAAGTYAGFTVATANLEVRGAQYNIDPAGALSRGAGDVDESMITSTIMITADNVTVNGFKTGYPINVGYDHAWYVNISYNISLNADGHWGAIHLHGIAAGPVYNQCDFAYIGYNTISGTTSPDWQGGGIWTVGNDDVTIEHNHILNSQYMGIMALNHVGDRNQILHNTITGSGHTPIRFWGGSQVDISYNVVDGGGSDGIWVDQAADNSTVSYNQVSNVTYAAVALRAGATGVNVHHNTITASGTGVEKHDDDITGITVNYNDIYGNSAGFGGGCSAAIDIRYNYWGGGGIGAPGEGGNNSCNATADYSPWLGAPVGTSPMTWGTDDSIQDAIDVASAGDVINVAVGMYEEQVIINKDSLTVTGVGAGDNPSIHTIIKSPLILTWFFTTSANNYPIVGIDGATGVTIQDLKVDGAGRGNGNYRFTGIGFWNGDGSVIDCEIFGVRDTPFSGAQHGTAIYSFNNSSGPYTINVSGTHFEDFQKNSMALSGNNLTANVENCTVIGHGLTDITAQNGIQISFGAGGTVTNCSVSDIGYTPATWIASGMLFLNGTSVVVNGTNSVTGSQASIVFQETQGSVDGVTISSADIDAAEGISIRDYGYYKNRIDEESIKLVPVSPLEEEWQFQSKSLGTSTSVAIDNSTITGIYHSGSYGVAAWSLGDNVNTTIYNSEIQDWEIGIVSYESGSSVNLIANSNNISNNDMGFWTNASSVQNAEANWWGDVLGPYHPTTNPIANGNEVADDVDYSPWWGANYVNDPHSLAWT